MAKRKTKPIRAKRTPTVMLAAVLDEIPSNWCDGLLTGPHAALVGAGGTWGCPDIERLLNGVRRRIAAAFVVPDPPHEET